MPKFTALVHVEAASPKVEETLKAACVANDMLVVLDEESVDVPKKELRRNIRKSGARLKTAIPGVSPGAYAMDSYHDWLLVLRPGETLGDGVEEELKQWKKQKKDDAFGYQIRIRDEKGEREAFRLVNKKKINWTGELPPNNTAAPEIKKAA